MNTIKIDEYPYVVKHLDGCEGDMYFINHEPKIGARVDSNDVITLDGSPVPKNIYIRCGSCGKATYLTLKNVFSRKDEINYKNLTKIT